MASVYRSDGLRSSTFSKLVARPEEEEEEDEGREAASFSTDGEKSETAATVEGVDTWCDEICRTPTAKECRIPEVLTCPPAPRKRRIGERFTRHQPAKAYFLPPNLDAVFADVSKVK